jgi:outer membrane protein OmpA-like peptidoglycan-associated protein
VPGCPRHRPRRLPREATATATASSTASTSARTTRASSPDGCPIPDTDGDGILDNDDKCPTEPEIKNGYRDEDGCPDEIPVQTARFTGTIRGVYFESFKAEIKAKSTPVLDRMVLILNEFSDVRLFVECHEPTNPGNTPDALRKFSLRRAKKIKRYLVERGIAPVRIEVSGAGGDKPLASNKFAVGRAKNRRCDFSPTVGADAPAPDAPAGTTADAPAGITTEPAAPVATAPALEPVATTPVEVPAGPVVDAPK